MIVVTCEKRVDNYYSVNFIDENDLYVGFDDTLSCCEHADWFISDAANTSTEKGEKLLVIDLTGWNFVDPRILPDTFQNVEDPNVDEGGHVAFMIVHPEHGTKWLHFFNIHNGYYGHEVLMAEHHNGVRGKKIKTEYL